MNVTNPNLLAPNLLGSRDRNLSATSGVQISHAVQSQEMVRHDYMAASFPTQMNETEGGWRHQSPFYAK